MQVWIWVVSAILLAHSVSAQEFKTVDPTELRIVISASEFVGAASAKARQRPEGSATGGGSSTLLGADELELRAAGYVHVVRHNHHSRPIAWSNIDLDNLARGLFKDSSRPLVIDAPLRHSRGGAYGDYAQFTHFSGSNEFKCVAYVLIVDRYNRLIGYACHPAGLGMTAEDAHRHVGSVGIKGLLDPG